MRIHPKLTWEEFQTARKLRSRRRWSLIWVFLFFSGALGLGVFNLFEFRKVDRQIINNQVHRGIQKSSETPTSSSVTRVEQVDIATTPSLSEGQSRNRLKTRNRIQNKLWSTWSAGSSKPMASDFLCSVKPMAPMAFAVRNARTDLARALRIDTSGRAPAVKNNSELLSVRLAWVPYHSSLLVRPQLNEEIKLTYRPLNSFSFGVDVPFLRESKWVLSVRPQLSIQRFQTDFIKITEEANFSPGSIVGYLQTIHGFEEVLGDTLYGIRTRRIRQNGTFQMLQLPIFAEYQLLNKENWVAFTSGAVALNYQLHASGIWSDSNTTFSLATDRVFGVSGLGTLGIRYSFKHIQVELAGTSSFQTRSSRSVRPWSGQIHCAIICPL